MFDENEKRDFLSRAGWEGSAEARVGEDWSQRNFFRLSKGGRTAILMQSVPDDDPRVTPGHKLGDYVKISTFLRGLDLSAPEVLAHDLPRGLLLVEDFGDLSLHDLFVRNDRNLKDYYLYATDVLVKLYQESWGNAFGLPEYNDTHIHKGRTRVISWYAPAILGRKSSAALEDEYLAVWDEIEKSLPRPKQIFQHGDYHPHNLMILDSRMEARKIGLIDFQGAMWGAAAYDLVNLLEDARRIVPDDIKAACRARYVEKLSAEERESFNAWYPVLAAQFHCRVIGQAIRLSVLAGKTRLMEYIPVLQQHLKQDLKAPELAPLARFFEANGIKYEAVEAFDLNPALFPDA